MAANPGAVPSTNSMPRSRMMTSLAAPSQMPSTGFGPDQVLAGLDDLAGKQRRHAGVQGVAQVGQPDLLRRAGRQQLLGPPQNPAQVGQRLHLLAGEGVDHRQVIGRVGEADGAGLAFGRDGLVELGLGLGDPGDGAVDGAGADQLRHSAPSGPSCRRACARPSG